MTCLIKQGAASLNSVPLRSSVETSLGPVFVPRFRHHTGNNSHSVRPIFIVVLMRKWAFLTVNVYDVQNSNLVAAPRHREQQISRWLLAFLRWAFACKASTNNMFFLIHHWSFPTTLWLSRYSGRFFLSHASKLRMIFQCFPFHHIYASTFCFYEKRNRAGFLIGHVIHAIIHSYIKSFERIT